VSPDFGEISQCAKTYLKKMAPKSPMYIHTETKRILTILGQIFKKLLRFFPTQQLLGDFFDKFGRFFDKFGRFLQNFPVTLHSGHIVRLGTDVMILKIFFDETFSEKIGVFDSKQSKSFEKLIITLVFEKNANFFAENWEKLKKIVIITSTPGRKSIKLYL
jgi:hypothetical protein